MTTKEIVLFNKIFRHTGIRNYWISEYGDIVNMNIKPYKIMKQDTTNSGHKRIALKVEAGIEKKFFCP